MNIDKEKNEVKKIKDKIGGMALFNGVLLRGKDRESVATKINEDIFVEVTSFESKKNFFSKLPIIRGLISIYNSIKIGIPLVVKSTEYIVDKLVNTDKSIDSEEIKVNNFEVVIGTMIASLISIFLYIVAPILLAHFVSSDMVVQNIIAAVLQLIVFIIYLISISRIPEIKTVFEYHGAEHKVVNAYESIKSNSANDITLEIVKKSSRFHERCGGNFIVYLIILSLITTLILPADQLIYKLLIEVLILPILIGLAYEIVMIFSSLPRFLKFLAYPAMAIQYITTKEPDDDKLAIAIYSLRGCLSEKLNISVKEYFDEYVKQYARKINEEISIRDYIRLVEFLKGIDKDTIYLGMDTIYLNINEQIKLEKLLQKLYFEYIPLQYIIGKQFFYNEEYIVNENVLIPRADTEILVENAIKYIEKYSLKNMIDMCTGSGCVGISIAKNSNVENVDLVDISDAALKVANKNIYLNNMGLKCNVKKSNLFSEFVEYEIKYDIIVSNPPYIRKDVIPQLSKYVQNEPKLALDGGVTGLEIYEQILDQATNCLTDLGFLMLEIGYDQKEQLTDLISKFECYELVECLQDLSGNDRVIICRFHKI